MSLRRLEVAGSLRRAVVSGVNVSPTLLMVHPGLRRGRLDHLHRPVKMTNGAGASVWNAVWLPWGGAHAITGAESLDARFPGQWYQLEAGLHYNWHRSYDPSLGRFTQLDPLVYEEEFENFELPGFQDGPSLYAYAGNSPQVYVDEDGRWLRIVIGGVIGGGAEALRQYLEDGCVHNWWQVGGGAAAGAGLGGPGPNWWRLGGSFSKSGSFKTFSLRWGSCNLTSGNLVLTASAY